MGYPRRQLWALLAFQAVESFSFQCISPFVNQMLLEIGVVDDPKDVGYWSGIMESIYVISQLITVLPGTRVADIYGRKPVVIWSAVIVAISIGSFGVSTTYVQMIMSRILGGVEGGTRTCLRVMASEMASKETVAHIFAMKAMAYEMGQILGQPMGGALSHPERRFPALFDHPFWTAYPYALPCFAGAAYALICAILGQIILKETLKRDTKSPSPSTPGADWDERSLLLSYETLRSSSPARKPPPTPTMLPLLSWPFASFFISVVAMVLITDVFWTIYPLFAFTPIELGGLGLSEAQIGFHTSTRSLIGLLGMLPFSTFSNRFGKLNVYRFGLFAWIPTILLLPFLNIIARAGGQGGIMWYAVLFTLWTTWSVTGWAGISVFVISSNLSPYPEAVTTIQGMVTTTLIVPQAFAPALGTSTFALAIKHRDIIIGGNLFWIGTFTFGTLAFLHSLVLRDFSHDWPEDRAAEVRE